MSFTEAISSVFSNYVNFQGRARRSEYWYFTLFVCIVNLVLSALSRVDGIGSLFGIVAGVFSLAVLIPAIAVGIRRLHDIGRSGFWLLLSLIPLIGEIILIIWYCKDSDPQTNQYGPCPK